MTALYVSLYHRDVGVRCLLQKLSHLEKRQYSMCSHILLMPYIYGSRNTLHRIACRISILYALNKNSSNTDSDNTNVIQCER
jgi:hypothetical protein